MQVEGKNILLRTVEITDADFIYKMRKNRTRTKYLSAITGTLEDQKMWIKNYKNRESRKQEFYFVIESKEGEKLGLVRMYDFNNDSFSWGSWLVKDKAPKSTAIESALQIYEFAFYTLGFEHSHFDVRKGNSKVIAFHKRLGAKIVKESDLDYLFSCPKKEYEAIKMKYKKYL